MNFTAISNVFFIITTFVFAAYVIFDTLHDRQVEQFVNAGARFTYDNGRNLCAAMNELRDAQGLQLMCCKTFTLLDEDKEQ